MKIVLCSSEVVPFAKTGGLADVCGALPPALEKLGHEVVVITPRYKTSNIQVPAPIVRIGENIRVCFIEHHNYFGREGLYGDPGGEYQDNLERFTHFCHKSFEVLKEIKFSPDIIHCHDWHTALIPVLLKTNYQHDPFFRSSRSVLTIHNMAYQGIFPKFKYERLGVHGRLFHPQALEFYDQVNVLKGGIIFAHALTTVSPQYAKEIQTREFGCTLDGVLRNRAHDISGILNGLDYETWNPKDDPFLNFPYDAAGAHELKINNKLVLQVTLGLPSREDVPLFGFVGRLCAQKGLDLIRDVVDAIAAKGGQVIFTGVGDRKYHRMIEEAAGRHPHHVGKILKFDEGIAHKIYAASDFFLMPSTYEPCGLGQMIALRYGSIPVVYKTGGLADTIHLYDPIHKTGNGFIFTEYTKASFIKAVDEALKVYHQKDQMKDLLDAAMRYRFSWEKSAREYVKVFEKCLS
ncbi:MAG: glycogen synthase [Candidatus Omnitrophica bacterium]|nr:glycogen synthase [Candidatus Omnitrophota bacterium]MDE2214266.1 glycogen synthase [Candidatus Omnitrophota bacterium]MDE2231303.1 glycogen synthase [Candidatus Omnitrophota bacterium]